MKGGSRGYTPLESGTNTSIIWSDWYKWMVLFYICWVTFGSYWVYDTPGAIYSQLAHWFGGPKVYTEEMNLVLYSVYSYPNVILAFFGGFIVDKLTGVRLGTAIFCGLVFVGQLIFALAIQWKIYWLAILGRFIFGLGGESLTVGQNTYTARWFDGKQMAFAFGIVLAFSRIGSSVNFLATPQFSHLGVPFAVWFGTSMCLISFTAVCYVALMDWYGEAAVKYKQRKAGIDQEPDVSFFHIFEFPLESWIIMGICVFFYIGILTFYAVASDILQHTGARYDAEIATTFLAIPNFVAIFASPFFGKVIDMTGRSCLWMGLACIMLILAHGAFLATANAWFTIPPYATMIWLGVGYSMFAASIWPLLPYVIREELLGTGYGTMTAIQNAGLAVVSQVIGAIQVAPSIAPTPLKYTIPIIIFLASAGAALGLTVFLMIIDNARTGGVLNAEGVRKQDYKVRVINAPRVVDPANPTFAMKVQAFCYSVVGRAPPF